MRQIGRTAVADSGQEPNKLAGVSSGENMEKRHQEPWGGQPGKEARIADGAGRGMAQGTVFRLYFFRPLATVFPHPRSEY